MLDHVLISARPSPEREGLARAFGEALGEGPRVRGVEGIEALELELARALEADEVRVLVVLIHGPQAEEDDPLEWVPRLRERYPHLPIVAAARVANVELVGRAIGAGASDFLVQGEHLRERVATLLGKLRGLVEVLDRNRTLGVQNERLREDRKSRFEMIGDSDAIAEIRDRVERVAEVPRPVLIVGERGTGKELVARAIHRRSTGGALPMIAVNCAALSESLLESELFGHEAGAFTGADRRRRGHFEQARGGSLFLDEIGCMSLAFQQKILRVVEYGTFTRVGGSEELRTDARILAATNADLRERIREGSFLSDLYDRLAFEVIEVPPLRARPSDIASLAAHFLELFAREIPAFRGKRLSPRALRALERYPFPGNVRELKNLIERAAYRGDEPEIAPDDIGLPAAEVPLPESGGFHARVASYKRRLIESALEASDGNAAAAARALEMSYDQFRHHRRAARGAPVESSE